MICGTVSYTGANISIVNGRNEVVLESLINNSTFSNTILQIVLRLFLVPITTRTSASALSELISNINDNNKIITIANFLANLVIAFKLIEFGIIIARILTTKIAKG